MCGISAESSRDTMTERNSAVVMRGDRNELGGEFGAVEDAQELVLNAPLIELRVPMPDPTPREFAHVIGDLECDLDSL